MAPKSQFKVLLAFAIAVAIVTSALFMFRLFGVADHAPLPLVSSKRDTDAAPVAESSNKQVSKDKPADRGQIQYATAPLTTAVELQRLMGPLESSHDVVLGLDNWLRRSKDGDAKAAMELFYTLSGCKRSGSTGQTTDSPGETVIFPDCAKVPDALKADP